VSIYEALFKFTQVMEEKLRENMHRGDWSGMRTGWLMGRADSCIQDLKTTLCNADATGGDVARQAADVANYMLMIADNESKKRKEAP
jgi:hypothetical protein